MPFFLELAEGPNTPKQTVDEIIHLIGLPLNLDNPGNLEILAEYVAQWLSPLDLSPMGQPENQFKIAFGISNGRTADKMRSLHSLWILGRTIPSYHPILRQSIIDSSKAEHSAISYPDQRTTFTWPLQVLTQMAHMVRLARNYPLEAQTGFFQGLTDYWNAMAPRFSPLSATNNYELIEALNTLMAKSAITSLPYHLAGEALLTLLDPYQPEPWEFLERPGRNGLGVRSREQQRDILNWRP